MLVVSESVEAIRSRAQSKMKNYSHDNVEALKEQFKCNGLSHIEVIAIRLYTTAISYAVNRALRDYSVHDIPVPTDFLPYIYALLNGLAKITGNQVMDNVHWMKTLEISLSCSS